MRRYLAITSLCVLVMLVLPAFATSKMQFKYIQPPTAKLFGIRFDRWMGLYYYFDSPIAYPEPEFRFYDPMLGDVYATAAIWSEGTSCILKPLSVGHHTLETKSYFPLFDIYTEGTIHLTIEK